MKIARLALILLLGSLLCYLASQVKHHTWFFEAVIGSSLLVMAGLLFVWTIVKDIQAFLKHRRLSSFTLTFLCIGFAVIATILMASAQKDFDKPSLLSVYYDGDYNGTGIDFKTDGTYIFDNSSIGISDYFYGTYTISGNRIVMDKDSIDYFTHLRHLEIKARDTVDGKPDLYLYQVDDNGATIDHTIEFRVVVDNRK